MRIPVRVRLAYGKEGLEIALADDWDVRVIEPTYVPGLADPVGSLREALREPIVSEPLRERVKASDRVGIVVNDVTRATPYRVILPVLLSELSHVPDDRIVLFVATGTHRSNTTDELNAMLGEDAVRRFRIVQNDTQDPDAHALVGTTAGGNAVWICRELLRCDLRVLTGFIEPHFFAGFSGGGKACMPGMARLDTVLRNHCPANIDHPKATWGVTCGNPIAEEIREAARLCGPGFLLNVTMNRDKQITGVFAGDLEAAHERGCESVRRTAMTAVGGRYDIVITSNSGHPLDLNLYQAVKGMSAAAQIVRDGGAIIVAADCWDGIPDHGQYKRLLFEAESPARLLADIRSASMPVRDAWQAQMHASICERADVHLFSRNLTDEEIARALLTPCRDIAGTVERLLGIHGRDARIAVLPEGPLTIPYIAS
jgi:lactate racemase